MPRGHFKTNGGLILYKTIHSQTILKCALIMKKMVDISCRPYLKFRHFHIIYPSRVYCLSYNLSISLSMVVFPPKDEEETQKHDPQFSSSSSVQTTPPSILSVHAAGIKTPPRSVTTKTPEKTVTTSTSGTVAKKGRMVKKQSRCDYLV